MIVKERTYPLKASLDEILLMRLPKNHLKLHMIEADYQKETAGYRGEQALDYYLSFLPDEDYYIFQHIRLKYEKWTFQIDFLLITAKFALIIEAKNMKGSLKFERNFGQLIQTHNEKEKSYEDPTEQAERQSRLLRKWLKKYFPDFLPVDYLVAMSNPNAILKTDSAEIPKKVCKPFKLIRKIEEIEKSHPTERIDIKSIKKLCKLLLKHHTSKEYDILHEYNLSWKEILSGVCCPECKSLPMVYIRGKWYCKKCGHHSKDAHVAALNHYFLLFPSITISQCMEFLHLPSRSIAQKLLKSMNLPSTGTTKNRVYYQKEGDVVEISGPGKQANRRSALA